MPEDVLTGRLLVASPWLAGREFSRTVVLILEHGDEGALGLVLNRPSETTLSEALPGWREAATEPPVVYVGGPVEPTSAIGLANFGETRGRGGWRLLFGRLGMFDLDLTPDDIEASIVGLRVFAGHAGWGPGQLEDELSQEAWFVVPAEPSDAFSAHPATLWHDVLRRQPPPLRSLAGFPLALAYN